MFNLGPFWGRSRAGVVCLIASSLLLVASLIGLIMALGAPTEKPTQSSLLDYQHKGNFDYLAYIKPPEANEENEANVTSFFSKIIQSITLSFSYKFLPDKTVSNLTENVEISAVLEAPGLWQKEISLVPRTPQQGDFDMSFPLDLNELAQYFDTIEKEIGARASTRNIIIKAKVYTSAETDFGKLDDVFIASANLEMGGVTLRWQDDPGQSKRGYFDELGYTHLGRFGYEITLAPNSLYGPVALSSKGAPQMPIVRRPGSKLSNESVDVIDLTFSYDFESNKPVSSLAETVEVTGLLKNPDQWSQSIVLVPKKSKTDDFSTSFLIDPAALEETAQGIDQVYGVLAAAYELDIRTQVHTTAQTDFGPINEDFIQDVKLVIGKGTIEWVGEATQTQQGSITTTVLVPDPGVKSRRIVTGISTFIFLSALAVLFIDYLRSLPPPKPSAVEQEAKRAKKKYKDMIVDVRGLPIAETSETVVHLSSLAELIAVADGLIKPVLHTVSGKRHLYLVIDGAVQYLYISEEKWALPSNF